jgi:hypothetical protein
MSNLVSFQTSTLSYIMLHNHSYRHSNALLTVTILIGFYTATSDPASFISRQLSTPPASIPPHALIISASLGNMFLVQCFVSLLFTVVTREARLTKYYLVAAAIGDLGHVYANYKFMGNDVFWDFGGYNDMMAGNVLFSVFLWCMRMGTLAGVFGAVGGGS